MLEKLATRAPQTSSWSSSRRSMTQLSAQISSSGRDTVSSSFRTGTRHRKPCKRCQTNFSKADASKLGSPSRRTKDSTISLAALDQGTIDSVPAGEETTDLEGKGEEEMTAMQVMAGAGEVAHIVTIQEIHHRPKDMDIVTVTGVPGDTHPTVDTRDIHTVDSRLRCLSKWST